ncbi:hypothetical protein ECP03018672_1842 [Escherichia coli P0301867.2]|nr:hypothetical protein ECP03018672_1842 [Escherichia coli P0301867.2]
MQSAAGQDTELTDVTTAVTSVIQANSLKKPLAGGFYYALV